MAHPRIEFYRTARAKALAHGDGGQVRAIDADLARLGYVEPPLAPVQLAEVEPTIELPPPPRRGRPPKPRCEHGMITERCPDCVDGGA